MYEGRTKVSYFSLPPNLRSTEIKYPGMSIYRLEAPNKTRFEELKLLIREAVGDETFPCWQDMHMQDWVAQSAKDSGCEIFALQKLGNQSSFRDFFADPLPSSHPSFVLFLRLTSRNHWYALAYSQGWRLIHALVDEEFPITVAKTCLSESHVQEAQLSPVAGLYSAVRYVYRKPTETREEETYGKPVKYLVTKPEIDCALNRHLHNSSVVVGDRVKIKSDTTWEDTLGAVREMDEAEASFDGEIDPRRAKFGYLSQVRNLKRHQDRLDQQLAAKLLEVAQDQEEDERYRIDLPVDVVTLKLCNPTVMLWNQQESPHPTVREVLEKVPEPQSSNLARCTVLLTFGNEERNQKTSLLDIFEGELQDRTLKDTVYKINKSWLCFQSSFHEVISSAWENRIKSIWALELQGILRHWDAVELNNLHEVQMKEQEEKEKERIAKGKKKIVVARNRPVRFLETPRVQLSTGT